MPTLPSTVYNNFFPHSVQKDLATENDWIYSFIVCDKKMEKEYLNFGLFFCYFMLDPRDYYILDITC